MLLQRIKTVSSSSYVRNLSWLTSAELIHRIFRLATTVTLARVFSQTDYGMVSALYTVFEFANVFNLNIGVAAKIVQARDEELDSVCNTVYWLYWLINGSLFLVQCIAAPWIAQFYGNDRLILPICALGLCYLMMPLFWVQSALLDRENRLAVKAWCTCGQALVANTVIVLMALKGAGIWSIVTSMILSYPVWIFIMRRQHPWRPSGIQFSKVREVLGFSGRVMGIELLNKLRLNIDYILVAKFLGLEALGVYFFAFNAGLGISQSVISSLNQAWYPDFCQVRSQPSELRQRYVRSLKTVAFVVLPLVLVQSIAAPIYIPLIFGQKWIDAGALPVLILICLSAVPIAISQATSQLLRAIDKMQIDLIWNLVFVAFFAIAVFAAVQQGIIAIAATVLVTQAILMPGFALRLYFALFRRTPQVS